MITSTHNLPDDRTPPTETLIHFSGIIEDRGKLYCSITDGRFSWIVVCDGPELHSFDAFRDHVASQLGITVGHLTQGNQSEEERARLWWVVIERACSEYPYLQFRRYLR